MRIEKHEFLVTYDYGTGGLWAVLQAICAIDITSKYPQLTVVDERPDWMDDKTYNKIRSNSNYNVNNIPEDSWLQKLNEDRPL